MLHSPSVLYYCREAERKGKQMAATPSIAADFSATKLLALNRRRRHQNHELVRGHALLQTLHKQIR